MKKLKALKGALIGVFVVAAACCVFAACGSDSDGDDDLDVEIEYVPIDNSSIVSMTLDDTSVKKTYLTYQSFSSEGLKATATRESGAVEVMSASELDIDYSSFDNTTAGNYTINVSYVENEYSFKTSYNVEVIEEIVGLRVDKTTLDYTISSAEGATISLDDVTVYSVDKDGVEESKLESGQYEFRFFNGGDEIPSLSGLSIGIYTIYAYRNVTIVGEYSTIDYECGAYVLCYVTDTLQSITFTSGTTTQSMSVTDEMTKTWTYTLTYQSGITRTITSEDVVVTGLDTLTGTKGEDGADTGATATVTYSETIVSSSARTTTSATTSVTYYIDAPEGVTPFVYSFNYSELESSITSIKGSGVADKDNLESGYFTGGNAFLQFDDAQQSDSNQYRNSNNGSCFEIKGEALSVTFLGTGTITVGFASTGGSNVSTFGLERSDGYYLKAESADITRLEKSENFEEIELVDGRGYVYSITGTKYADVKFTIEEPGTYILATNIEYEEVPNYNRGARINKVEMIDIYDASATSTTSLTLESSVIAEPEIFASAKNLDYESIDLSLPQWSSLGLQLGATGKVKN